MKLVFIGCVEFSFKVLKYLLSLKVSGLHIVGVITKEASPFNADFASLVPLAIEENIPYWVYSNNNQPEMIQWLRQLSPDVIYCLGWPHLLQKSLLELPKIGVIGYHPTALPRNRGRHPIIWTLVLGLQETASTFFFMDEGIDSGDILSQYFLPIDESDDALTVYNRLVHTACQQISEFTPQLMNRTYKRIPQDHLKANYWRKRNISDGIIDWRMSARSIHNLVRALTRPYMGSFFIYKDENIRVWKTSMVDKASIYENVEPGKILKIEGSIITVKCGEGLINLLEYEPSLKVQIGDYL